MKTIQELYTEVMGSQELKAQFIEAANAGKQEEFLKAHGCEATLEEVKAFLEAKAKEDAPLSLDEMENAAGKVVCQARSEHCFLNLEGRPIRLEKDCPEFFAALSERISEA